MEHHLAKCDLLFTGEGQIDGQTLNGKTVTGVSKLAKKYKVPVMVLAGKVGQQIEGIYGMGATAVFPIVDGPMELEEALKKAPILLQRTAQNIMRAIKGSKL